MTDLVVAARLARWLGPWAPGTAVPPGIVVRDEQTPGGLVRWYRRPGRRAGRTVFLVPGLHPQGPADPRFDRFARVFAASGRVVAAPFLPDYLDLRVSTAVFDQVEAAYAAVLDAADADGEPPTVFSISFGSLPAFHLASSAAADRIRSLIVFGGYADWLATVRFALTGVDDLTGEARRADPLNRPAVFTNLVHAIPDMKDLAPVLVPAWREFCMRTWGRPEMHDVDRYGAVAHALSEELPGPARAPFLRGCGLEDGGIERCMRALEAGDWSHLDPAAAMAGVRCPVHVIHGVDDDVIPHTQVDAIAAGLTGSSAVRTYRTGLYGHTGASSVSPRELGRELWTMVRVLGAMAG